MIKRFYFAAIGLAAALLIALPALADPGLTITLGAHTVSASGLSRGSSAVFFAVLHEPIPGAYMNRISRLARVIVDDDKDGVATLDLGRPIPATSVWAVVEPQNGHYGITTGRRLDIAMLSIPPDTLRKGAGGVIDRIAFGHASLDLLYVHPGQGAWTWSATDGDPATDADGHNGITVVSLNKAQPVGGGAQGITDLALGGTLVAIDPDRMEIGAVHIDGKLIGGAR
jgi:hypothetical protein